MDQLTSLFTTLGPNVAIVVVLLYWLFNLQKKLVSIIESNTAAMTAQTKTLETLVTYIREGRRKEFTEQ